MWACFEASLAWKSSIKGGFALLYELHLKVSHEARWFERGGKKKKV